MCYTPIVASRETALHDFGLFIAYLVPGATLLLGFSLFSPRLQTWLATNPVDAPTLGGFLYLTVASLALGMMVSAVRWVCIDTIHELTGLPQPTWDFSRLGANVEAFRLLIEIHYRHYLFYSNMVVATAIAYLCYRLKLGSMAYGWVDLGFLLLEAVLFATSRDTLRKYYRRGAQLLASPRGRRR
jgi:hypothetical protein